MTRGTIAAVAGFGAEFVLEEAIEQGKFEEGDEEGKEGGEEPEGEDQVPEHAVCAVEAAELGTEEFEAL